MAVTMSTKIKPEVPPRYKLPVANILPFTTFGCRRPRNVHIIKLLDLVIAGSLDQDMLVPDVALTAI